MKSTTETRSAKPYNTGGRLPEKKSNRNNYEENIDILTESSDRSREKDQ